MLTQCFRTSLPLVICDLITNGTIKKIHNVSFGSSLDSWFFYYETANGGHGHKFGSAVPMTATLSLTIGAHTHEKSPRHIQLGDGQSWVAWIKSGWQCSGVPKALCNFLLKESEDGSHTTSGDSFSGKLATGMLKNVQWHPDGSYYVQIGDRHFEHFEADLARKAWTHMWTERNVASKDHIHAELAVSFHCSFLEPQLTCSSMLRSILMHR